MDSDGPYSWDENFYQMERDNIGNIVAIYDLFHRKVFEAEYDAWGKQTVIKDEICFNHGFTGHEMLPGVDLIHMDGRVYDPAIGRFLSPDNYVQLPENSQSFNRYSYCINNPLKYTDPDGQIFGLALSAIITKAMFATMPSIINNLASGDNGWTAIGKGILSGVMSYGIGSAFTGASKTLGNALLKVGAHGLSGGVQNALNGENFGIGFATGALSSLAGYGVQSAHLDATAIAGATTLTGGLTSWALGGDFLDGALIGLSIGMMNENMHPIDGGTLPELICNGKMPFWMRAKEALEPIASVAGNLSLAVGAVDHVSKNARIDSNGKFRFRKSNGRIQQLKTKAIPNIPYATGIGAGLSIIAETPEVYGAFRHYGWRDARPYRALTVATGTVVGGFAGSYAGTIFGGIVGGAACSAVPIIGNGAGFVAGGMAGGMIGSFAGSEIGGAVSGCLFDVFF